MLLKSRLAKASSAEGDWPWEGIRSFLTAKPVGSRSDPVPWVIGNRMKDVGDPCRRLASDGVLDEDGGSHLVALPLRRRRSGFKSAALLADVLFDDIPRGGPDWAV